MILSICIPTVPQRNEVFLQLYNKILKQVDKLNAYDKVEIVTDNAAVGEKSTGKKRNDLLLKSKGEYICFIDDDDDISDNYVDLILYTIERYKPDCIGMLGKMTYDGVRETKWNLSKDNENEDRYVNGELIYYRKANHLSPIKREHALKAMFPDISNAEDKGYSEAVNKYLKTETFIGEYLYHYRFSYNNKLYV